MSIVICLVFVYVSCYSKVIYECVVVCVCFVMCLSLMLLFYYRFTRGSEEDWGCSVCTEYCEYYLEYVFQMISAVWSYHVVCSRMCYVRSAGSRWTGLCSLSFV